MTMDHLLDLLKAWSVYMKQSTSKQLGYPTKSSGMYGGGTSTSFDELYESMTSDHVRTIDAIIHSLPERQQNAVYHRYLGARAEALQDYHMSQALDNLLTISSRRIPS